MSFVIVTLADPLALELQRIEHDGTPDGQAAVAYSHRGHVIARGVVSEEALPALESLLGRPVTLALAAREDDAGNIDGRICLVLPIDPDAAGGEDGEPEPWKSSVPAPPFEDPARQPDADGNLALLPIGNVVRAAAHRNGRGLSDDAREMLGNLLTGRARDAVARAIDDLLGSL